MNKEFNNLKDEELLKKVEELIDGKNDRQRFTDSFLGFCSRLIGVKPKPDADFQLSLKRSLLEKYHEREVESRGNFVLKLTTIREFITMKNIKWFVPAGAVAVIALLVVIGTIFFKNPSSVSENSLLEPQVAYAKDLVNKAEEVLNKSKAIAGYVEPTTGLFQWKEPDADGNIRDEKGNIIFVTQDGKLVPAPYEVPGQGKVMDYTFTKESFLNSLDEAKQAKDLTYLGDKIQDGKRIRVLQFTDSKGNTTILGIDESNLPVVRISFNKNAGGGVMFQQGEVNGNEIQRPEGIQYGKIDPNAPKPMDLEQQIKYWTENLEQPTDFEAIQK